MARIVINRDLIESGSSSEDGVLPDIAFSEIGPGGDTDAGVWDILAQALTYGDDFEGKAAQFVVVDDDGNEIFRMEGCLHWDEEFPRMYRIDHILTQILDLIVIVLKRLEVTVTVQSNAVLLSNRIQQSYTNKIGSINLLKASQAVDDFEDTEELEEFKSDNETIQKRLEDLRNARTSERDAGKELTDAMKSTNDTLEQQSQLGSSIIQQMGELIRSVFR